MAKEYRKGFGVLYEYDASELAQALETHPQLTKELGEDRYLTLCKTGSACYRAEVVSADGTAETLTDRNVPMLLEQVAGVLERLAQEGDDVG